MAAGVVLQVVALRRRRWTLALAAANAALNVAGAVPALWLLAQDRLLNQAFWSTLVPDDPAEVGRVIGALVAVGIVAAAGRDTVDGFRTAFRARRSAPVR